MMAVTSLMLVLKNCGATDSPFAPVTNVTPGYKK